MGLTRPTGGAPRAPQGLEPEAIVDARKAAAETEAARLRAIEEDRKQRSKAYIDSQRGTAAADKLKMVTEAPAPAAEAPAAEAPAAEAPAAEAPTVSSWVTDLRDAEQKKREAQLKKITE